MDRDAINGMQGGAAYATKTAGWIQGYLEHLM